MRVIRLLALLGALAAALPAAAGTQHVPDDAATLSRPNHCGNLATELCLDVDHLTALERTQLDYIGTNCPGLSIAACFEKAARIWPDVAASAMAVFTRACAEGDGRSCTYAGFQHEEGLGTPLDLARAEEAYTKGCDLEHGGGCTALGAMAELGDGAPLDLARAATLYGRACRYGDAKGNVYKAFCDALEIAPDTSAPSRVVNPSPTFESVPPMLEVNRSDAPDDEKSKQRRQIMRNQTPTRRTLELLDAETRAEIVKLTHASVRLLERTFVHDGAPLFPAPDPSSPPQAAPASAPA